LKDKRPIPKSSEVLPAAFLIIVNESQKVYGM